MGTVKAPKRSSFSKKHYEFISSALASAAVDAMREQSTPVGKETVAEALSRVVAVVAAHLAKENPKFSGSAFVKRFSSEVARLN